MASGSVHRLAPFQHKPPSLASGDWDTMPLYFAYGSNMDRTAMLARCPHSRPVGPARLMRHRFFVMDEGYASVLRDPAACGLGRGVGPGPRGRAGARSV